MSTVKMEFSLEILKSCNQKYPVSNLSKIKKVSSIKNCRFTIEPDKEIIVLEGNSDEEIHECASKIIRILSRDQRWRFCYSLRKTDEKRLINGKMIAYKDIPIKVSLESAPSNSFYSDLSKEYKLHNYYELFFNQAILNNSMKKNRVAFLLAYSMIESVVKLLVKYHCNKPTRNKSIKKLFDFLKQDSTINLKIDVSDFDDGSRFKEIRNDIAHGGNQYPDKLINNDVERLFDKIDELLRFLSSFININQQYI